MCVSCHELQGKYDQGQRQVHVSGILARLGMRTHV